MHQPPFLIFLGFAAIAICFRLMAGSMDKGRIENYLKDQDATLLSCNWSPFARGWFGSKNERLYEITYTDSSGNLHNAVCKTSMLSGVYFTEDEIVSESNRGSGTTDQTDEVASLRNEVAELKRKLNDRDV